MLRLTLLRHGHAVGDVPGGRDVDRPLTPLGRDEALQAGHTLVAAFTRCDLLFVSTARRTRETAEAVLAAGFVARRVQHDKRLYLGTPSAILEALREEFVGRSHVVVVGHNPGLSELAGRLSGDPATPGLDTAEWRSFEIDALP